MSDVDPVRGARDPGSPSDEGAAGRADGRMPNERDGMSDDPEALGDDRQDGMPDVDTPLVDDGQQGDEAVELSDLP